MYEQTEGISKKFEPSPVINSLAHLVADFRKGNNLPRATEEDALAEIDAYNCQRLGNNPAFCYQTDKTYPELRTISKSGGGCGSCGIRLK